jgi:hypothetical protein
MEWVKKKHILCEDISMQKVPNKNIIVVRREGGMDFQSFMEGETGDIVDDDEDEAEGEVEIYYDHMNGDENGDENIDANGYPATKKKAYFKNIEHDIMYSIFY